MGSEVEQMANKEVWVYAEQRWGRLITVSLELLAKASELCQELEADLMAVIVGNNVEELAAEVAAHGANKVYQIDSPELEFYHSQAYASIIADLLREQTPDIFLIGATEIGEDLAPCIAAKLNTGLTAHCIDLKIRDYRGTPVLFQTVPGWGGGMRVDIICPQARPQIATVKPGVFAAAARREEVRQVIKITPKLTEKMFRARTVEMLKEEVFELPLEEAEVVVSAGWGCNSLASLNQARELSEICGGALAGTRPMLDKGYITADCMIGQSGKIVAPKLFISLGASGAMHFTTGFERAKFILAVDQNPRAPIFQVADIGIVGDVSEVVPALIQEFKRMKS